MYDLLKRTRIKKTRVPHCCVCCNGFIPVGGKSLHEVAVWEGKFQSTHLCEDCERDSETVIDEADGLDWLSFTWGEMWEAIHELRSR